VAVVAAGMAVTLVPRLLAPRLHGVRLLDVRDAPTRTLAAVLPPTGQRRVARAFVREARLAHRRSRTALRPAGRSR
jgi:DNA-binding transcriptional LysR family regulator